MYKRLHLNIFLNPWWFRQHGLNENILKYVFKTSFWLKNRENTQIVDMISVLCCFLRMKTIAYGLKTFEYLLIFYSYQINLRVKIGLKNKIILVRWSPPSWCGFNKSIPTCIFIPSIIYRCFELFNSFFFFAISLKMLRDKEFAKT